MKKITSILLALLLLAGFMPTAAFAAEEEPTELVPSGSIVLDDGDNFIIRSGNYEVADFLMFSGSALTRGPDAKLTVTDNVSIRGGTIHVLGAFIVNPDTAFNDGTIIVGCCGTLSSAITVVDTPAEDGP